MSCYICGKTHADKPCPPGYTTTTTTENPECPPVPACDDLYNSHCIYYSGPSLECVGIFTGDNVNDIIANFLSQLEDCCLPTTTTTTSTTTTTTSTTTTSTTTTTTACPINYLICCSSYDSEELQIIEAPCDLPGFVFTPWETYQDITNGIGANSYVWVVATLSDIVSLGYSGANISYVPNWTQVLWASAGGSSLINTLQSCNEFIKPSSTCPEEIIPTTSTTTTSTTTTTTINQECSCYTITNLETSSGVVAYIITYIECFTGLTATVPLEFGQSISLCCQPNSIETNFSANIYNHGTCGDECPPASTTTTSTTTIACVQYNLYNPLPGAADYQYVDCEGNLTPGLIIQPDSCVTIYALPGSVVYQTGVILGDGPCCNCITLISVSKFTQFSYIDCNNSEVIINVGVGENEQICGGSVFPESGSGAYIVGDPCYDLGNDEFGCTTTTTTVCPCNIYELSGNTPVVAYVFTECGGTEETTIVLGDKQIQSYCIDNATPIQMVGNGTINQLECCPVTTSTTSTTTTSTTTALPCNCYVLQSGELTVFTYNDCTGTEQSVSVISPNVVKICASTYPVPNNGIGQIDVNGPCISGVCPPCKCYMIYNPTPSTLYYTSVDCEKYSIDIHSVASQETVYACTYDWNFIPDPSLIVSPVGLCGSEFCGNPESYCHQIDVVGTVIISYIGYNAFKQFITLTDESVSVCAWEGSVLVESGTGSIIVTVETLPCTSNEDCTVVPTTTTTTTLPCTCYELINGDLENTNIALYYACEAPDEQLAIIIPPSSSVNVCAITGTVTAVSPLVTINNSGTPCTVGTDCYTPGLFKVTVSNMGAGALIGNVTPAFYSINPGNSFPVINGDVLSGSVGYHYGNITVDYETDALAGYLAVLVNDVVVSSIFVFAGANSNHTFTGIGWGSGDDVTISLDVSPP